MMSTLVDYLHGVIQELSALVSFKEIPTCFHTGKLNTYEPAHDFGTVKPV